MSVSAYPLSHRFLLGRARHRLSEHERGVVEGLITDVERFTSAHVVLERGDVVSRSTLLIEGFVARVINEGGRRHIVALHVPGDFVDLHAFALKRLDHSIVSIGPVMVGYTTHKKLEGLMQTEPHLSRMLWFSTLLDAAMHREWIMKLEQSTVPKRIAHVFAEIWRRLEMVGQAFPDGFETPLRQSEIAEMCGATAIHTNRALADLRRNDLADFRRGEVRIRDRARLEDYAGFRPDYLYGEGSLALRRAG